MAEIIKIPGTKIKIVKQFYEKLFEDIEDLIFVAKPDVNSDKEMTHYINVNNIDYYRDRIEELGGKITVEKTAVPRMGFYIEAKDPEGHYFGLWEENKDAEF